MVDSDSYEVLCWDVHPVYYWYENSNAMYFTQQTRGYKYGKLIEADAETGKSRVVISEYDDMFFDRSVIEAHPVHNGEEIIWHSERDGWHHLYLYDGKTGKLKNQITAGEWLVRSVVRVDEKKRQIFFMGAGREAGSDPYYTYLYKINFDGSGLQLLTPETATHDVTLSPDGRCFIDTYSRVDLAPVTILRRASDGNNILDLEKADIDDLIDYGYKYPEAFKVKARDGKTDVYGVLYRPINFDPSKKYPIVEYTYSGPHSFYSPKSFWAYRSRLHSVAQLGFIVVQMDGMGTGKRSRAFHEVSYRNLQDGGLEDHITGIRQLAEKYPYMDVNRVGIFGYSAGGYDAVNALLRYPDFYKVGMSASGNHDHRMDKADWNEMWMDFPVGQHYIDNSNITRAHMLKGKLLLALGDIDNNVPPFGAFRLVDALVKANKDFDLLILPNRYHDLGYSPYFVRRMWDYFVKHLHNVEPPKEFELE